MGDKILVLFGRSYDKPILGLGDVVYQTEKFLSNPEDFKLILFTGGEDITPSLYGETSPEGVCWFSESRDKFETLVYNLAIKHKILMAGICRGMQFFNVMNGGRMMHHIGSHNGGIHDMETIDGRKIPVNSIHHQMIIPAKGTKIVGWSSPSLSDIYIGNKDKRVKYNGKENEAAIFTNTRCFGVQYHPELMDKTMEGYKFFRNMVELALTSDWEDFVNSYQRGVISGDNKKEISNDETNTNNNRYSSV